MKKILVIMIFFLASCTSSSTKNELTFSDKMTFEQFKLKLNEYVKNNPYPDVNE
tara:strand:- start:199 stop:360 length:162 start_codon:yes stop_codon:yes gene_type:complete